MADAYTLSSKAFAVPLATSSSEYGRSLYSSERFNASYPVPTLASRAPGPKWSPVTFNSNVHASASNERFLAMRKDSEDVRPFAGAPFHPQNVRLRLELHIATCPVQMLTPRARVCGCASQTFITTGQARARVAVPPREPPLQTGPPPAWRGMNSTATATRPMSAAPQPMSWARFKACR